MPPKFRKLFIVLSAVIVMTCVGATAYADTVNIVGVSSGNRATATMVCSFNAQTNTLTFTITNTSNLFPGSTSTITGIGFDLPPLGNASASGLNGFTGAQAPSLGSTFTFSDASLGNVPAGLNNVVLDFGFTTGPSGNFNGGSPNDGLTPGESASFTVSGAPFAGFTESQICNAIFVRFQDVPAPFGSDVGVPGTPTTAVPEPSTMLLMGTAFAGLSGFLRRRMRHDQSR